MICSFLFSLKASRAPLYTVSSLLVEPLLEGVLHAFGAIILADPDAGLLGGELVDDKLLGLLLMEKIVQ